VTDFNSFGGEIASEGVVSETAIAEIVVDSCGDRGPADPGGIG
jgi:hypothetical protein